LRAKPWIAAPARLVNTPPLRKRVGIPEQLLNARIAELLSRRCFVRECRTAGTIMLLKWRL
jgi:hypothetical protein